MTITIPSASTSHGYIQHSTPTSHPANGGAYTSPQVASFSLTSRLWNSTPSMGTIDWYARRVGARPTVKVASYECDLHCVHCWPITGRQDLVLIVSPVSILPVASHLAFYVILFHELVYIAISVFLSYGLIQYQCNIAFMLVVFNVKFLYL